MLCVRDEQGLSPNADHTAGLVQFNKCIKMINIKPKTYRQVRIVRIKTTEKCQTKSKTRRKKSKTEKINKIYGKLRLSPKSENLRGKTQNA